MQPASIAITTMRLVFSEPLCVNPGAREPRGGPEELGRIPGRSGVEKVKADSETNGALANYIDSYFMDPTSFSALR